MPDDKPLNKWRVLVLAASRGPNEPMALAYGVSHKCLIEVGGKPMLARVVETLLSHEKIGSIGVCIENREVLETALGSLLKQNSDRVQFYPSKNSAPASVLASLQTMNDEAQAEGRDRGPVLVTTADHALLDQQMLDHFLSAAQKTEADLLVGLARAEIILAAYPHAKRTFVTFGADRVSGCNLFGFMTPRAEKVLDFWQQIEKNRKNPLKLVAAFGIKALATYMFGVLFGKNSLAKAFDVASKRIGVTAKPVLLPFANAAVDVDKPEDKELVEEILAQRQRLPAGQ